MAHCPPLPIQGPGSGIERWIGTNTDIEDERRASQSLINLNATLEQRVAEVATERDRLWQTSQDLLVMFAPDGTFTAANPAWTSFLGWRIDEVVGKNHAAFVFPDDRPAAQARSTMRWRPRCQRMKSAAYTKTAGFVGSAGLRRQKLAQ